MEKCTERPQCWDSCPVGIRLKNSRTGLLAIKTFITLVAFTSMVPMVLSDFSTLFDAGRVGRIHCTNESLEVNSCVNKYHELDFVSIIIILYPPGVVFNSSCKPNVIMDTTWWSRFPLEDPTLKDNLDKIQDIYACLREELQKCDQLNAFFALRHLLFAFQKIITWLNCGNGTEFQCSADVGKFFRFIDILKAGQCLECYRQSPHLFSNRCNFKLEVTHLSNLWAKIIRLEVGPEVCPELEKHYDCFNDRKISSICSSQVHTELLSLFIESWCRKHPLKSLSHLLTFSHSYLIIPIALHSFKLLTLSVFI